MILNMVHKAGKGHLGGSLSCVDIIATLYLDGILKFDPKNPKWEERDRFIFSKGHSCEALYVVLAEAGFFPLEWLDHYREPDSPLQGHPSPNIPGVEIHTGSLGHGLPVAVGMAYALKLKKSDARVFCLLSDGDLMEGSTDEASTLMSEESLHNMRVIVDCNGQITLKRLWKCDLDWANGYSPSLEKWSKSGRSDFMIEGPQFLYIYTKKGQGISFMEGVTKWHHSPMTQEEYERAMEELK